MSRQEIELDDFSDGATPAIEKEARAKNIFKLPPLLKKASQEEIADALINLADNGYDPAAGFLLYKLKEFRSKAAQLALLNGLLSSAVTCQSVEAVRILFASGANYSHAWGQVGEGSPLKGLFNEQRDIAWEKIDYAVVKNQVTPLSALLRLHPDIPLDRTGCDSKYSPLYIAASRGYVKMMRLLMDTHGAQLSATPGGKSRLPTVIETLTRNNKSASLCCQVVLALLNSKVDPNVLGRKEFTWGTKASPLAQAVDDNQVGVAKLLLRNGADVAVARQELQQDQDAYSHTVTSVFSQGDYHVMVSFSGAYPSSVPRFDRIVSSYEQEQSQASP